MKHDEPIVGLRTKQLAPEMYNEQILMPQMALEELPMIASAEESV